MATDVQTGNEPGVASLVKGIIDDVQHLTKQQFQLIKQEMKEDATKTVHAAMPMAVGAVVCLVGLVLLGHALAWILMALQLDAWVAYLIVGGVITGAGAGLVYAGWARFQTFNPLPDRSLEALKENVQCLTNPEQCLTNPK
jgi:uncharacterized membrane protein YcjF (UPF0283 family)